MGRQMDKKKWGTIGILVLASFVLRWVFLSDCLFHHDSIELAKAVQKTIDTASLQSTVWGREGFVLINTFAYAVLSTITSWDLDYILNIITAFFGALSVGAVYLFVLEWVKSKRIALMSSILFSISPLFLSVSVYAKSHAAAVFFAVLSGYFLLCMTQSQNKKQEIILGSVFGVLFLISLSIRSSNLYYLFGFFLIILFLKKDSLVIRIKKYGTWIIGLGMLSSVLFFDALFRQTQIHPIPKDFRILVLLLDLAKENVYLMFSFLGIALLIFTAVSSIKIKKYRHIIFPALIWIAPLFMVMSIVAQSSARFYIPLLVAFIVLISIGIEICMQKKKEIGWIIFILLALFLLSTIIPIVSFRHEYCGPKEFALFVKDHTEQDAIIISNDEGIFFNYYANRSAIGYPQPWDRQIISNALFEYYQMLQENKSVYVTSKVLLYEDKPQTGLRNLGTNFVLQEVGTSLNEEFHHASLKMKKRNETLFRLKLHENKTPSNFRVFWFDD